MDCNLYRLALVQLAYEEAYEKYDLRHLTLKHFYLKFPEEQKVKTVLLHTGLIIASEAPITFVQFSPMDRCAHPFAMPEHGSNIHIEQKIAGDWRRTAAVVVGAVVEQPHMVSVG